MRRRPDAPPAREVRARERSGRSSVRRLWSNYSLSIVLLCLFLVSWGLQTWMGWREFAAEQQQLGAAAQWLGQDGYLWAWGAATFENWQSEFLQLLTFVVLTTYLVHRGSHESKDTDEAMQRQLDRIEQRLEQRGA
ncbi:MAG TPA: DUF6766 family protein [Myxococcota bacterium]|nr:DUF6766 family protein [Myxococcota bacterium]